MQDRRLTTVLIAELLGVGKETARQILEKRCAEKEDLFEAFAALLNGLKRGSVGLDGVAVFVEFADRDRDVLRRTVTADECWCFISILKRNGT